MAAAEGKEDPSHANVAAAAGKEDPLPEHADRQEDAKPPAAPADSKKAEPVRLEDVVVSATRIETPAELAPASATVLRRQDLSRLNAATTDEALRNEAGVEVKRSKGIADATPRVQMRGLYGQNRTLVLIDGMPVNDGYNGDVPLTQLAMDNLERVEIVRGPGSALYGGNAMGGVINLITRRPTKLEAMLRAGYGTSHTYRLSGTAAARIVPTVGLRLGVEREATDGYANTPVQRPLASGNGTLVGGFPTTSTNGTPQWVVGDKGNNGASRNNVNVQTDWDPAPATRFKLDFQLGQQRYGYDAPHTYLTDPSGAPAMAGGVAIRDGQQATVTPAHFVYAMGNGGTTFAHSAATWEQRAGDLNLTTKLGYQRGAKWYTSNSATGNQSFDDAPGTVSDATTQSWQAEVQGTYPLGMQHVATGGVAAKLNLFTQSTYALERYRDENSKGDKTDLTRGRDQFAAAYLQDEWHLTEELCIFAGARLDFWHAFDGRVASTKSSIDFPNHDDFAISPKLAGVWTPLSNLTVRASAGRAFRPPTIYELYRTWQSGTLTYHANPELKPETLWNAEVGAEHRLLDGRIRLAATVYRSWLFDAIENYTVGSDRYTDNVSRAILQGVEGEVEVRPMDAVRLWANAAFVDPWVSKNPRNPAAVGKKLTNVAMQLANIGVEYDRGLFRATVGGNFRGRLYTAELNDDTTDVYGSYGARWLWSAKATIRPVENVDLSVSVENALDTRYYDYYVGRGRTFFAEVVGRL